MMLASFFRRLGVGGDAYPDLSSIGEAMLPRPRFAFHIARPIARCQSMTTRLRRHPQLSWQTADRESGVMF